ncbi:MAG: hypothetical protein ACRESZ_00270, partial [Methylococcales bacterium]
MPNLNAIVSSVIRFEPPLDRAPVEMLRAERGLSVELEGGRRVGLDPANPRSAGFPSQPDDRKSDQEVSIEEQDVPLIKLPPVSDKIRTGRAYLVAEMIFKYNPPGFDGLVWLILVELETGSILYIECMTCGVNGLVFKRDPMVKTGDLTITSDDSNAALNPQRDDVTLTDLGAPVAGVQSLTGTYVTITNEENPNTAAPTEPKGTDFDYDVRTNNFGAVNAHYHQTELIKTIESLG